MARAKQTFTQRDFSLGVAMEELLERDDLEIRDQSLRDGENLYITVAGTARQRPGTLKLLTMTGSERVFEMRPPNAGRFGVIVTDTTLSVIDENYEQVALFGTVPWTSSQEVWMAPFGNAMIIGPKFYALEWEEGNWTFGELSFDDTVGGERAIPFWSFEKGITLQPSDYTGGVTVTASSPIFSSVWEGKRIRYAGRQLQIDTVINSEQVAATVIDELPPTYSITVGDVSGYSIGEILVASDTSWRGVLIEISGNNLICVTLALDVGTVFSGPTTSESIAGSGAFQSPSAVVKELAPREVAFWDEQLFSDHRGWPRSGASVNGRLALCDFPLIPDLFAISSTRSATDFEVGQADDDAIVRQTGNNTPRFLHVVATTDVLLFSDRGLYYVRTRDGELLTPSNFMAVQFDDRGANSVRPALVDQAVVFVDAERSALNICLLTGNVYLNWSAIEVTRFHRQLMNGPDDLCGPVQSSVFDRKMVLSRQADGKIVAMFYNADPGQERAGFVPWSTRGSFEAVFPLFNAYHVIANRNGTYVLERFDPSLYLDSTILVQESVNAIALTDENGTAITDENGTAILIQDSASAHLASQEVHVWEDRETIAVETVDASGTFSTPPSITNQAQVGLQFTARGKPWPREVINSERHGMLRARLIRVSVGYRDTVSLSALRNGTTNMVPIRRPQDPQAAIPPLKTDVSRFTVFGNRAHPDVEFFSDNPGPFEMSSITQECQA